MPLPLIVIGAIVVGSILIAGTVVSVVYVIYNKIKTYYAGKKNEYYEYDESFLNARLHEKISDLRNNWIKQVEDICYNDRRNKERLESLMHEDDGLRKRIENEKKKDKALQSIGAINVYEELIKRNEEDIKILRYSKNL